MRNPVDRCTVIFFEAAACCVALLSGAASLSAAEPNLVANGSFQTSLAKPGVPDAWAAAGNAAVRQFLTQDSGRDGGRFAKLECTAFDGDGPDSHVMLCQVGKIGVRQGRWYRMTFSAKAKGIQAGAVDVALSNTRRWANAGLSDVFTPQRDWQSFAFVFRAKEDLPPEASRLQIWFKGTGTLWLDDVTLTETAGGLQWFPQISTEGVKNFIPNSSFECGDANWGSLTWGLSGWAGNLYRLEGQLDPHVAHHGRRSLRISLSPKTLPVFYFDYYEPVRQPVRRVLAANRGWLRVTPGKPLTLSAFLKADRGNVVAQLAVNEAPERLLRKQVAVGTQWQRHEFTLTPSQSLVFVAVGLDLEASGKDAATLWVDAVQLERGDRATAYEPRRSVESFLETAAPGNVWTDPAAGLVFTLHAYNDTASEAGVQGTFQLIDFFDRTVAGAVRKLTVPAHDGASAGFGPYREGKTGYYRASWTTRDGEQRLRCASILPAAREANDSPLGFNHAYPWDFLVERARQAGVLWWRDWSAKWHTVEPQQGRFNFDAADVQIRRIRSLQSEVEVLLPFPSAPWSTSARRDEVEKAAGGSSYLRQRLPAAYPPKNLADFGRYAAAVADRYGRQQPRPVTHVQILNEPVYTDYALPRQFGYTIDDYIRLLEVAYGAIKQSRPQCRVVGGISAGVDAGPTREFVAKGGLRFLDVFDLHMYDPARTAESYEDSFASLAKRMAAHGGPKPVWITEWGCYADDDPACVPETVGDETMNRCRWSSERSASEFIVKFTATSFAHNVRKIFFHAGTCGAINGPDAGGVLFEYGGTPRKMYAAVAALNRLLGVPEACARRLSDPAGLRAYVFQSQDRFVAIAWCGGDPRALTRPPAAVRVYDMMGNAVDAADIRLTDSPLYAVAPGAEEIVAWLTKRP